MSVVSGMLGSGLIRSAYLVSGALRSSYWSSEQQSQLQRCHYCQQNLSWAHITLRTQGGWEFLCCFDCAGFTYSTERSPRENIIRASCPLDEDTPRAIVADWLDDQGRDADAAFLRNLITLREAHS